MRIQVRFSCRCCPDPRVLLVGSLAVLLSGCWIPPSASVRPGGKPRVIEDGIVIDRVLDSATVEGVDRAARRLTLSAPGVPLFTYEIGRGVLDSGAVRTGDHVRATIKEVLTVYVAPPLGSRSPGAGLRIPPADARVLVVDPSYRMLTVRYTDGGMEAFKIGLHAPMEHIEAGDSVAIRRAEVTELRMRRH